MPFRSPFPAVSIPNVPLTDFVFGDIGAYRDRTGKDSRSALRTIKPHYGAL